MDLTLMHAHQTPPGPGRGGLRRETCRGAGAGRQRRASPGVGCLQGPWGPGDLSVRWGDDMRDRRLRLRRRVRRLGGSGGRSSRRMAVAEVPRVAAHEALCSKVAFLEAYSDGRADAG